MATLFQHLTKRVNHSFLPKVGYPISLTSIINNMDHSFVISQHVRNIVRKGKCEKVPKTKPKKCSSLPHFTWHFSSFHNKCLAKYGPSPPNFSRHSSSFHKKCQAKNVFFTSTLFQALLLHKKCLAKKKCLGTRFPGSRIFHTPGVRSRARSSQNL